MERQYFLPMTTGVSKVASHMTALAAARTNRRTAISNCTDPQLATCLVGAVLLQICGDNLPLAAERHIYIYVAL
jgi:hypothetical protein